MDSFIPFYTVIPYSLLAFVTEYYALPSQMPYLDPYEHIFRIFSRKMHYVCHLTKY